MFLNALEIQGFKSFPDRTKIQIDQGITAVVGPNGSGKSNISDAIRWVLGETSAKQLRGGGKMENVIFGGTQTRGAMGFASVNLYIDNVDRRIEVDKDEVIIGRKYYRSGDSEYSINGQNVRLKDIYELFLDTGIGRDGYSIIGQGRIAEIVGAKSGERREIFEEASGIAKYRYRKNEAERRLNSAQENLLRLRDILDELETRVIPLEKESEKAKKYLTLSQTRKELEVTLWVDTVQKTRDTVREQQRNIEIANADYTRASNEMQQIDKETEEIRMQSEQMIKEIDRYNADIRTITQTISGSDAQLAVLQNNISHNEETITSLSEEINQGGLSSESIAADILEKKQQVSLCQTTIQEYDVRTKELTVLLTKLQNDSAASGERRGVVQSQLAQMAADVTDLKVGVASANSAVTAANTRLSATQTEMETATNRVTQLREEKQDTDAFLKDAIDKLTQLENIKKGLSLKLENRRNVLEQADAAEQKLQREMESAQQRIALLRDLERNMDGFQSSVKTVMKASANRRLRGIIGPVSTILSVKAGYEIAIETALGFALQNIVVENESAAKAAMAFLRDERAGRATFLPLDTVKPGFFDASKLPEGALVADSLVTFEEKYKNIVTSLLGRIVIVEDINEASRVARQLSYRNRIVTKDGQVINAGGSFTGGSVSRSVGLFSRKQEIDDLKAKLIKMEAQRDTAQEQTDKAKEEVDALAAELTATESEAIVAGGDKIRGEVESERIKTALSQAFAAKELLQAEAQELLLRIQEGEKAAQEAEAKIVQLERQTQQLEQEVRAISGTDDNFLEMRTQLSDELSELKLVRLSKEKDIENYQNAIAQMESYTGETQMRAQQLASNIDVLKTQNAQHLTQMTDIKNTIETGNANIEMLEQKITETAAQRMEKDGSISRQSARLRTLTDDRENLSREIARLTEQKETKETEYEQTVAKLWEEYELTLSDAQRLCVAFETTTELRRLVNEVRGKMKALGHVNIGAIEEYAEVSERYEFLRVQVADVEKSRAELMKMIATLSDEMRTMFSESFVQINQNFARIFTELFGGGTAQLVLDDESDVLESGITIEVTPPGKIIKHLSALSGGEQALVAISIYFAILAVNPAPFCVLDEIEAALDDVNVTRFAHYLRRICKQTQFIVITHRRGTMEEADVLYGVTMQDDGISKILRLDANQVDVSLIS